MVSGHSLSWVGEITGEHYRSNRADHLTSDWFLETFRCSKMTTPYTHGSLWATLFRWACWWSGTSIVMSYPLISISLKFFFREQSLCSVSSSKHTTGARNHSARQMDWSYLEVITTFVNPTSNESCKKGQRCRQLLTNKLYISQMFLFCHLPVLGRKCSYLKEWLKKNFKSLQNNFSKYISQSV